MLLSSGAWLRVLRVLLLAISAALFALHFVHLSADFPNYSPWMDWSKYTDEGWYGDAAIRHYDLGHWYVPGDFNPAAALPVWPLLEALVFRFTGVSLIAARALTVGVFGGILLACHFLVRRWSGRGLTAEAAVLLLVSSAFCFVFTRLAILEPFLVLMTLLLLLVAGGAKAPEGEGSGVAALVRNFRANGRQIVGIGVLLPLLVLTKTTGLFLVPCVAFLLWGAVSYRVGTFLRTGIPAAGLAAAFWLMYYGAVVRPHYLLDYRYLFSANGYTRITPATAGDVLLNTLKDGAWMGLAPYCAAIGCVAIAAVFVSRLRRCPLIPALVLWAVGYEAFLAYHNNLQPRYYLVVAVPLTLLIPVTIEQLVLSGIRGVGLRRWAYALTAVGLGTIVLRQAVTMIGYVRHPEYTLTEAAQEVKETIAEHEREDPTHNPLVLSISGSELSLMTGIRSICDDFGTLELADRVKKYRPGWYVAWNQIDDDKMDALTPYYHIERVAAFPAMDDPDRNLLIVYRLDESVETPVVKRKRKGPPKALVTKVGQQPSTNQLEH